MLQHIDNSFGVAMKNIYSEILEKSSTYFVLHDKYQFMILKPLIYQVSCHTDQLKCLICNIFLEMTGNFCAEKNHTRR